MPYKKYYIYKEQKSVDMGSTWEDTGNRTQSGDPIGEYSTKAECEGKEPCYDGKCKILVYGLYREVECNNNPILTSGETRSAIAPYNYNPVSVVFGCCVTGIGEYAFREAGTLTSATIPDSVTHIYNSAFWLTGLTAITIPNSVVYIGSGAFLDCHSLTSVTIGSGITTIKREAFKRCSGLTSITIEAITPPALGDNIYSTSEAFDDSYCPIYVPAESVDAYKTADKWSVYANRIQPIP